MVKSFVLFIFLIFGMIFHSNGSTYGRREEAVFPKNEPVITYKIIPSMENTWGYDIYINQQLAIHQPSIPTLPGNKGFATKAQAEKVAKAVIQKIKKGSMPPTITSEELKELKVI